MFRRFSVVLRAVLAAAMVSSLVVLPPAAGAAPSGAWAIEWERYVGSEVGDTPRSMAVADDGSYYVVGSTLAKYSADGSLLWRLNPGSYWEGTGPAAVACDDDAAYLTLAAGWLMKFDATDGSYLWDVQIPGWGETLPSATPKVEVYDGVAYATLDVSGSVAKMDTANGDSLGTVALGITPGSEFKGIEVDSTGLWVAYDDAGDAFVHHFDHTGVSQWSNQIDGVQDPALASDGTLYLPYQVSGSDPMIVALRGTDGLVLREFEIPGGYSLAASLGCGSDGAIHAVLPDMAMALKLVFGPTTESIDNGILKMIVTPEGLPAAYVWNGSKWVTQYYSDDAWGNILWLNEGDFTNGYRGETDFTPVSNEVEILDGGKRIVTVYDAGDTGVRVTQTFTIMDGDRYLTKDWKIDNLGEATFENVRLYHGGDTYFGGTDSASSYYDSTKSMVYVRNNSFLDWGIMGFYANPATPADHYFSGRYNTGNGYAENNQDLPDTADEEFKDAGYYLQWDKRGGLAPADSWNIQAFEVWTPGGPLQVLAPGSQNVLPGSTVILPFTLHNIGEVPQDITLSVESDDPAWDVEIVGSSTPDVGATERIPVQVRVTVPEGATEFANITLKADGPETNGSGSTRLNIADLDFTVDPTSAELRTKPGKWKGQSVTITNNSDAPIKLGEISFSDPDHFVGAGEGEDNFVEIGPGESRVFGMAFGADEPGTYPCTVSFPIISPALVTATVQLTGIITASAELKYVAGTGGSIEGPATQTVDLGSDAAAVTAVPDAGYRFTSWSDGVTTAQRRDTAVTGDATVTANFVLNTYLVTYTATSGGSIEGVAAQGVTHGTSATPVTAVPAAGYRFVKWSDGVTTPERHDIAVNSPKTLTANFEVALGDPAGITFGPKGDGNTTIKWSKAQNATGYKIYLNGKLIATVGPDTTSHTVKGLLGPKAKVRIKAMGDGGFESELVAGGYKGARYAQAGRIRFSGFSGQLTPKAKRELRRIAGVVKSQGFTRVEVGGHTSTVLFRGDAYHKRLSAQRAETSKKYLESELKRMGVKAKVVAKGYGKSKPIASNLSWWGRFQNRRVEVSVK